MHDNQKRIVEIGVIVILLIASISLVWYYGVRTYNVTGEVSALRVTDDGLYLVTLDDGREVSIERSLLMPIIDEEQVYGSLMVGQQYTFVCWGEPVHIFQVVE
jgi:hypothetical protein